MEAKPYIFSYTELRAATDDFSTVNKVGEGGFGPVYKVTFCYDGSIIMIGLFNFVLIIENSNKLGRYLERKDLNSFNKSNF